jgi:hypothetical protein
VQSHVVEGPQVDLVYVLLDVQRLDGQCRVADQVQKIVAEKLGDVCQGAFPKCVIWRVPYRIRLQSSNHYCGQQVQSEQLLVRNSSTGD